MRKFTKDEIAKGYMEMRDINLSISKEYFEAENQAMEIGDAKYEMGKEDTKDNT